MASHVIRAPIKWKSRMRDRPYQAVLFDLDGTLTASEILAHAQLKEILPRFLKRPISDREASSLLGKPISTSLPTVFPELESRLEEIVSAIFEDWRAINHQVRAYTDIPTMLQRLKDTGYGIGIATSKRREFIPTELRASGLDTWIDVVVTFDDCPPGKHKPDPYSLCHAAQQLGYPVERCVYVGDQSGDILAAHAAKMPALAALWGHASREQLEPFQPSFYAETPGDIFTFLEPSVVSSD